MDRDMTLLDDSSSQLSTAYSVSPSPDGSSSPLSMLSRSPSPPRTSNYPSPPSSQQTSQNGSPCPDGMDEKYDQPPAKRRRISKERTTEYLDLNHNALPEEQQHLLERLVKVIHKRKKIVVVAGAGISVSADIPDFRSKTGIFNTLKQEHKLKGSGKDMFDASVYRDHESTTSFHSMVQNMSKLTKDAQPTSFHHMLATLAQEDRLLRLYSQNVDGIEVGLGPLSTTVPLEKQDGKWPKTVQLHGGLQKMVCIKCHAVSDLDAELFSGPVPPSCSACAELDTVRLGVGKRSHGIGQLRPRMVLYSEPNPDESAIGQVASADLRRRPDAVIVVGTTLKVPGVRRIVREMCAVTRDHRDGVAIWINNDPPPPGPQFEDCFDLVVTGTADAVAAHASLRRWDFPTHLIREDAPTGCLNNSFKAPSEDSSPAPVEHISPSFSPIKPARKSVYKSIETSFDGDDILVGLPTPTKSIRGSPPKQLSVNDKFKALMDGSKAAQAKKAVKSKTAKSGGSKSKIKTSKKTSKPQASNASLSRAFTLSRATAGGMSKDVAAKEEHDDHTETSLTSNKLRTISNPTLSSPGRQRTPKKSSPYKNAPVARFPNLFRGVENNLPA
ncbi:hypothetical protein AMS68_007581 [Peltaster fructicola]|uniref:Deacetylase sirtuin-type domain-containing protein n=1 Tax=Peltaster fructicola TaxID=286661 RepID=A0A6H0Y4X1_9PEZI|nr:hypothetical protein AMS68_007581 [Peltaster fructicola]